MNNARSEAVTVVGVRWEIVDAHGQRHLSQGTVGESSGRQLGAIRLAPGSALRLRTTLPKVPTPSAKISGVLIAKLGLGQQVEEGQRAFVGEEELEELEGTMEEEEVELIIAPMGASVDGGPVTAYEPLGFLS